MLGALLYSLLTIFKRRAVSSVPLNKIGLFTWKYFFEIAICSCWTLKPGFPECPSWMSSFLKMLIGLCGLLGLWLTRILVALKAPFQKYPFPPLFQNWWVTQPLESMKPGQIHILYWTCEHATMIKANIVLPFKLCHFWNFQVDIQIITVNTLPCIR